jgi:UDPglucose--hexose-1-phosphate uridylyltransferase
MADFQFLQNPIFKKWVILDPRRAQRPNVGQKTEQVCPFCIGREQEEQELYRVGGEKDDSNWHIRVVVNKFPFASHHEIIIHSPDHHKNFEELPLSHIELVLQTYRERYRQHQNIGQVYIFHNRGIGGGESLPHPHTQLTVLKRSIVLDLPPLDISIYPSKLFFKRKRREDFVATSNFYLYCPFTSQWPDEVWIVPRRKNTRFGDINDHEIADLAFCLNRLINIFDLRHGHEFSFNFYIYPGKNWYLRIIPRIKILGGFEVGTGIMVNTQDPQETFAFVKEHFFEPNLERIRREQQADYWRSV